MRLTATTTEEAALLEARLRAIARILGPTITLEAVLPGGQVIHHPPARSTASDVGRLISEIRDHLQVAQNPTPPGVERSEALENQPQRG